MVSTFPSPLLNSLLTLAWKEEHVFPRRTRQRLKLPQFKIGSRLQGSLQSIETPMFLLGFPCSSRDLWRHRSLGPALIKDASAQSIMCATLPCSPGSLCWGSGKQGCRFSCTSSNLGNARTRSFSSLGKFAESRRKFRKSSLISQLMVV
jgi:hypothetical protein